jgi:L,D-transpeptidase YcbB
VPSGWHRPVPEGAVIAPPRVGWTPDRIAAALAAAGPPAHVALPRPIPVALLYATAVVDPGGKLRFATDIYGHDARLDRALTSARRPPSQP